MPYPVSAVRGRMVAPTAAGGYAYDGIANITALYAMRRGLTSYTGSLIRLRRGSDNAESDFGYDANGDLDTGAIATWLGGATGYFVTWYDQSGNGNDAAQATTSAQPVYSASGPDFGGSHHLDTGINTLSNNQTASMIARFSGAGAARDSLMGSYNGSTGYFILRCRHDDTSHIYYAGGNSTKAGALTAGVMGIAGNKGYLDGAEDATIAASGTGTFQAIYIGAWNLGGTATNPSSAVIHEALISASTYDGTQMATITTIMQAAP